METRYKELEILISKFVRQLPEGSEYANRLEEELELIAKLGFAKHFTAKKIAKQLDTVTPNLSNEP